MTSFLSNLTSKRGFNVKANQIEVFLENTVNKYNTKRSGPGFTKNVVLG